MCRRETVALRIEDDSREEAGLGGPGPPSMALLVARQAILNLIPDFSTDYSLVLTRVDGTFVLNFAYIYMVAQNLV